MSRCTVSCKVTSFEPSTDDRGLSVTRGGPTLQRMKLPLAACAVLIGACTGAPRSITPVDMAPVTPAQVAGWVAATQPHDPLAIQYGAIFTSQQYDAAKGSGTISIVPTDSLRFDFRGPLGSARSAAVVVGDSALWAEPKEDVEKMIPNYPLLWAMVGVARPPQAGEGLRGIQRGELTAWQYTIGSDTVTYVRTATEFRAEVTIAGKRVGQVVTRFADGQLLKNSRLDVASPQARLEVTFRKVSHVNGFPRTIWDAPQH